MIDEILKKAIDLKASDVQIYSSTPVSFVVKKKSIVDENLVPDSSDIFYFMRERGIEKKEKEDLDTTIKFDGWSFRASIFEGVRGIGMVLRRLPREVPDYETLGLPGKFTSLIFDDNGRFRKRGLILVVGETNSGKTTTLASLLKKALEEEPLRVVTLEDPVEYDLEKLSPTVIQREVGKNVESFYTGLKSALRQNPDVIVVGEIRDRETMRIALHAAISGHVVMATFHASNTVSAVDRIKSLFPSDEQPSILESLSSALWVVQAQMLFRNSRGELVPIVEILHVNRTASVLIKEGKIAGLEGQVLWIGDDQLPMDMNLVSLYNTGKLTFEEVLQLCRSEKAVRRILQNQKQQGAGGLFV